MRTSQFLVLFLCSLIGFSGNVMAQDSIKLVPTISVDSLDLLTLQMEDDLRDQQGLAPRYAVPNLVEITAATHGHWEKLDDDFAMWRLRFTCKNAISMNFGFKRWLLPIDSSMMIYNVEGTHRIRPFTIDDYNDSGELWTPAVAGGDVIIEIRCPQNAVTLIQEEIKLTSVNAGYRGFHEAFGQQPLPGNVPALSGACNIDVACPESVGWENEIDCVGVISTGGSTFCTGFMVNNTSQDGTPYFMTADHCGIFSGNAPSLVVYWNYENSFCRPPGSAASGGPGDGVLNQFSTGSIYRAGSATSDFTLVELNSPPNATFGVSFCGWDASTAAPTSAVGIHHPATDEKRISFENQPPSLSTNFVTVNDWDAGTTEPGSSGSPLFDQNHRVIGQLCCGAAACGNNLSDDYGRFSRSWNLGLSAWLDSAGTGQLFVDTLPAGGGGPVEQCSNGTDDDGDGLVDCNDPDCAPSPACGGGGGGGPANDLCGDAQAVGEGVFAFDNSGAFLDGPTACDGNMDTDVWFAYTASASGTATIETCGTAGSLDDSVLIVYDGGTCPPSPTCLASDDDGCTSPNFSSTVTVPVVGGNTYLIQVGGWNGAMGNSDLSISLGGGPAPVENCTNGVDDDGDGLTDCSDPDCSANPACGGGGSNDLCINATPVDEGSWAFDNSAAALDGPTDCDGNMATDVWFLYTASATGTATIGTCNAGGTMDDTVLIVYDGSACPTAGAPCIASADDTCANTAGGANFMSDVAIPVAAGNSYLIQVGGWNGTEGTGDLSIALGTGPGPIENCSNGTDDDGDGLIDCNDPDCVGDPACGGGGTGPANDDCANAQAVGEGLFAFDNTGAILDGPVDCDGNMSTDVWFAYTPSASGTATIATCGTLGSMDDTVLIVYDGGTCPSGPACLASDDDGCASPNFSSTVEVPVAAGNTYLIQVGGWNGATGTSDLVIDLGGGPAPVENCTNGVDDDGDGFIDCEDTDCDQDPACTAPPVENCTNGTDDDGDGLADCSDPDCSNDPSCVTSGFSFIAQDANATYSPDTGNGSFTGTVSASEDSAAPGYPNDTQGFSFGLAHDATLLSANGFNTGSALTSLNSGNGPDFLDVNTYSDGLTVGCVYSFSSPGTVVLQLTSETDLGTIDYDTVPSGLIGNSAGTTTSLSWSNALGAPPVINIMVVGGQANPANLVNGTITLVAAVGGFVRGDVNDDGSINIADAVSLLAGLFTGGSIPCSDSADANDDGSTNIADAVYVLANLFSGGPGMPAPSGPACGPDPTADALDCANYNSCP